MDRIKMAEDVVTVVSLPERIGAKTERSGSALWRAGRIYDSIRMTIQEK